MRNDGYDYYADWGFNRAGYPRGSVAQSLPLRTLRPGGDPNKASDYVELPAPFWIIWNPTYPTPPQVKFTTLAEAERIAADMARKFRTDTFHVLKVVSTSKVTETPVTVTRY